MRPTMGQVLRKKSLAFLMSCRRFPALGKLSRTEKMSVLASVMTHSQDWAYSTPTIAAVMTDTLTSAADLTNNRGTSPDLASQLLPWEGRSPLDYADLINIVVLQKSPIERKRSWRRDSIRHNSEGGIIRGERAGDRETVLGLVGYAAGPDRINGYWLTWIRAGAVFSLTGFPEDGRAGSWLASREFHLPLRRGPGADLVWQRAGESPPPRQPSRWSVTFARDSASSA